MSLLSLQHSFLTFQVQLGSPHQTALRGGENEREGKRGEIERYGKSVQYKYDTTIL